MEGTPPIEWRLHLNSAPDAVYDLWATDPGRQRFWGEKSVESPTGFRLQFINGQSLDVKVLDGRRPERFAFLYFGGSTVTVSLTTDGRGGCDLLLVEEGVPAGEHSANRAGWVSVLLALKAAADFGVDLRSHDASRSWDDGYVDN